MTASPDLELLERDIEEARARLARDLDRLRSSETISHFKSDLLAQASETKDQLVGKAKESVGAGMQDLWRELKARAAANPAAALALGAGLAWRLVQRPPVASALVGIGLVSLWRTDPRYPAPGADLAARSAELFETAKQQAEEASVEFRSRAGKMHSAAAEWAESGAETMGRAVQATKENIDAARQRSQEMLPVAADRAKAVMSRIGELSPSDIERDQVLLGAAALALAAAVSIAAQRRYSN
jgi:hypothetical protein